MPYLSAAARNALAFSDTDPESPGELNYIITLELLAYLDRKGLSYQTINDVLGALEGAKLEFYARVARPYEETRLTANGDVY